MDEQLEVEHRAEEQAYRTPRLTAHARQRCAEMGIRTRIAKRIVMFADVVYPGPAKHGNNWIALWREHPEYAVAFTYEPSGRRLICTVLYHGVEFTRPHRGTDLP